LIPPFPLSTGLLPAFSPPQGAFVTQQSTTSEGSRPMKRSYASSAALRKVSTSPSSIHSSRLRLRVLSEQDLSAIFS